MNGFDNYAPQSWVDGIFLSNTISTHSPKAHQRKKMRTGTWFNTFAAALIASATTISLSHLDTAPTRLIGPTLQLEKSEDVNGEFTPDIDPTHFKKLLKVIERLPESTLNNNDYNIPLFI